MKVEAELVGGEPTIVFYEVFNGVGFRAPMGLFGVAMRDDGIEVMLEGRTVWTSHEIPTATEPVRLPDGSGCFIASMPLPKDHWLYTEGREEPPAPFRGVAFSGLESKPLFDQIRTAARYAIRCSTMNGKLKDFDPDAMVQNMIIGLFGAWPRHPAEQSK